MRGKQQQQQKKQESEVFNKKSLFICGERMENLCCKLWLGIRLLRNHFNVLPKPTTKCNLLLFKYPSQQRCGEGKFCFSQLVQFNFFLGLLLFFLHSFFLDSNFLKLIDLGNGELFECFVNCYK